MTSIEIPLYENIELADSSYPTALVIPIFNEGDKFLSQLEKLHRCAAPVDIFIADGGSSDGVLDDRERLIQLGVRGIVIVKEAPGISRQLKAAFAHTQKLGYKRFITMDGNSKDDPKDLYNFIDALDQGYDFIQGSRYVPGGEAINTPILRTVMIKFVHAPLTSIASRRKFTDSTNGFRGMSAELLFDPRVAIFRQEFKTYELLAYLPIRASRLRFRCIEVPVRRVYPKDGNLPTKITGITSHINLLLILLKAFRGGFNIKS